MRDIIFPIFNKYFLFPFADKVMHTKIMHYYFQIIKMNSWSADQIIEWQTSKLKSLLNHAFNNTIYYKNIFDNLRLHTDDIGTLKDLSKLPVLTKELIISNYNDLIPLNINNITHIKKATGGSTGDPLKYLLDKRSWSFIFASNMYYWSKIGYKLGQNYIALGSSSLFLVNKKSIKHDIYYWLKGKISLNAMNLSDEVLIEYLNFIKKNKIKFIYGYASAIYLLAKKSIEISFKISSIKGCITTSEILLDEYREKILKAFNCDIIDAYGASDGGVNAFKINDNNYYVGYNCLLETHENAVNNYNENFGKLLSTDLFNYSMPLIRYELGDEVKLEKREPKIFNGQIISKVLGRTPDIIKLKNGRVLTGPGFTILFKDLNVNAYKIWQVNAMELTCQILPNEEYTNEEEKLIISTFKKHAGDDCKINIEYINKFELTSSGKRRYFLSK